MSAAPANTVPMARERLRWQVLAYGALFVLTLPPLLAAWARRLDQLVRLPIIGSPAVGLAVAGAGLALLVAGVYQLRTRGGGWPMSPFPPRRLVTTGVYRLVADPIYLGAVVLSSGLAVGLRSPAGLWIVSPTLALAAAGFVLGYERDATRERFGTMPAPLLHLPPAADAPPSAWERAAAYVLVFLPWLVAYQGVEYLGVPRDARSAFLSGETGLPVLPWTEAIYAATYPFVLLVPLAARRQRDLRRFMLRGLGATALIIPLYLLVPLVAQAKPVPEGTFWAPLMRWERLNDQPVTAFPAFHAVWALLAADLYAAAWPRLRQLAWIAAAAIAAACVTTGMHALLDVAAGVAAFGLVGRGAGIWNWLCRRAEAVANSRREWTLGPVRIINHGFYAGLGTVGGLLIAVPLAGPDQLGWLAAMVLGAIVGAGLWAQIVEGSPQLLRPYGYFGSAIAVVAMGTAVAALGGDGWLVLGAFGVGGCVTQAAGRIRCLVQGCCHGRAVNAPWGLRYTHPHSRVVRLAGLGGVPLHPTQLYSILWTLFTGAVLLRLWILAAPLPLIVGGYFFLIGLGRFVEEHYRGEPQTAQFGGLALYQWLAMAFVVGGAAVTAASGPPAPALSPLPLSALPAIGVLGFIACIAYGVDFPHSRRRFSRLT